MILHNCPIIADFSLKTTINYFLEVRDTHGFFFLSLRQGWSLLKSKIFNDLKGDSFLTLSLQKGSPFSE